MTASHHNALTWATAGSAAGATRLLGSPLRHRRRGVTCRGSLHLFLILSSAREISSKAFGDNAVSPHRASVSTVSTQRYSSPVLTRLVHISRPVLWVNTVGPTVMGVWLIGDLWRWEALALLLWATLPFNLLIYGVNDIFDQETDAQNPRKGGLEGARILSSETRTIVIATLLTNVPFGVFFFLTLPPAALAWVALYIVIFVFYSAPPLRFKARRFLDALSNAAYAFPLVFVPLSLGEQPIWAAAVGLMAWSVAKHTFDAVQDIDEDRTARIRTTAVYLGARGAVAWSGAWWALSTAGFALVNWPVAVVNALIAGWLVVSLGRAPTPATARRLYRYSIAFPYVAGSVAGAQIVAAILLGYYS